MAQELDHLIDFLLYTGEPLVESFDFSYELVYRGIHKAEPATLARMRQRHALRQDGF